MRKIWKAIRSLYSALVRLVKRLASPGAGPKLVSG